MNTLNTDTTLPVNAPAKAVKSPKGALKGKGAEKVKATAKAAAKPPGKAIDPYTGPFANLKLWPVKTAGAVPSRECIIQARALIGDKLPGSKRILAVAAYLRADADKYTTGAVATALMAVCGGNLNPLLNVANADVETSMKLGKVIKVKVAGGTAYKLELNDRGLKKVEAYKAMNGLYVSHTKAPVEVAEVPVDAPVTDTVDHVDQPQA